MATVLRKFQFPFNIGTERICADRRQQESSREPHDHRYHSFPYRPIDVDAFVRADSQGQEAFIEFFTAQINNDHSRKGLLERRAALRLTRETDA